MSNSNWYQTESWYAPLTPTAEEQPKESETKKPARRKGRVLWAILIPLILVGAILAGIGLPKLIRSGSVEAKTTQEKPSFHQPAQNEEKKDDEKKDGEKKAEGSDKGFGKSDDGAAKDPQEQDDGDEMPEDWNEFFANYYQETDTSAAQVNIQRTEAAGGFSLKLHPASEQQMSLQQLYEHCAPSIVAISGYIEGQSGYNWGTGVVLSEDGLILTNTHVIDQCDRATVTLSDDREFEAELIGADTISDIAVLKIDAKGLIPAEFGQSANLQVGDPVAAIGNPLGDTFRSTLTDGIISAISRDISYKGRSMVLLQTNTALNEGNSGGALFNMQGQVVGITNMKMMSSYSSIEGIGFAIPSATVREVVNSMVVFGEVRGRPSIGITVGAIPEEAMEQYALPAGLYITAVLPSSDAYAQGVREGDVLTQVNGIQVTKTNEVTEIKDALQVGDTLHFVIWRNGETLEFDVALMDTNDLYGG